MRLLPVIRYLAAALIVAASASRTSAQCDPNWIHGPEQGIAGVSGTVLTMTRWDPDGAGPSGDRLVVGGQFALAGSTACSNVAMWDGTAWRALGIGVGGGASPGVFALVSYQGELIAGGRFTSAGGMSCENIARWNGTTWAPVGPGTNDDVRALIVFNGELIAAGEFVSIGGSTVNRIARWDGVVWRPLGAGLTGGSSVFGLSLGTYNSQLIVGGRFQMAGGVTVNSIARWDGAGWWPLGTGATGPGTDVQTVIEYNSELIAGGTFPIMGGITVNRLARWDGTTWRAFVVGEQTGVSTGGVHSLAVYQGDLFVGGSFVSAGPITVNRLARWNGTAWLPTGGTSEGGTNRVYALLPHDGVLIAAGDFGRTGDIWASNIARWGESGWKPLGEGFVRKDFDRVTYSAVVHNGDVVIGGRFGVGGDTGEGCIARWDGAKLEPMGEGVDADVLCLASHNGELIAGGDYVNGGTAFLARWDGAEWQSIGDPLDSPGSTTAVNAIVWYRNELIVGGSFNQVTGGPSLPYIARQDGASWSGLGSGLSGRVNALAVYNDELVAGGVFSSAGGVLVSRIAAWNGVAWRSLDADFGVGSSIHSLAVQDGYLYAGGSFTTASGSPANRIARWNGTIWEPLGDGVNDRVHGITPDQGSLIVTGNFAMAGGIAAARIARWANGSWSPLATGIDGDISSFATTAVRHGSELIVGGSFDQSGDGVSVGFARWSDNRNPWIAEQPSDTTSSCETGSSVSFSVTPVSGYDGIACQWRRELPAGSGVFVPVSDGATGSGSMIAGSGTSELSIAGPGANDAGLYDCVVSNGCGSVTSEPARLGFCRADLVCDGVVDFTDYLEFLNLFEAVDPRADMNGDGVVDFIDYLEFLNAFDAGC